MAEIPGYAGKILRVNLSTKKIVVLELRKDLAYNFLGGSGFGTKILWDEVGPGVEPFSADNRLIFAIGPLTGTIYPTAGRFEVIGKSPLTGIYGDANSGGHFAPKLKQAGFDAVVFQGRSTKPVYLLLNNGKAELRDAGKVWNHGTEETERILKEEVGDSQLQSTCIGQAGENLVRYASVMNNGCAAARSGLGALMGFMRLKAIAAQGDTRSTATKSQDFIKDALLAQKEILDNPFTPGLSKYGTAQLCVPMSTVGRFPTKNFQQGDFEFVEDIGADAIEGKYFVRRIACSACPIGCHHVVQVKDGKYAESANRVIEYESVNAFGARVWNRNLPSIIEADRMCDDYGLDTISTGASIAFAMELWEKGILTEGDIDLDLSWGNPDVVLEMIRRITFRKELGNILAEGVKRASEKIGKGSDYYAMHIKGQEIPSQDGRSQQSMGLAQATSSRGADHLKGFPTIDETGYPTEAVKRYGEQYLPEIVDGIQTKYKAMVVKDGEEFGTVIDSIGICKFGTFFPPALYWDRIATALSLITGFDLDVTKLKLIGERIVNLQRMFNVREGITRKDDTQPRRLLEEKSPSPGRAKGHVIYLKPMLDDYYRLRNWNNETGIPTNEKLKELSLEYTIPTAERMKTNFRNSS
ncbi:MAG: aldehyde ferredoxin oxidoreductase family protein [Candidatus Bathyarchaeia archaeon]